MIGAIVGDIVGSIYEFNNHKSKDFDLFGPGCTFTDDTVLTVAVADWLLNGARDDLADYFSAWTYKYPHCSYGAMFQRWLSSPDKEPYNSYGNGSAMRVSPCAWVGHDEEHVLSLAYRSAKITHDHLEGIKGAQTVALAIWLGRQGNSPDEIKEQLVGISRYDLSQTVDEIRPDYRFDETCQGTVPQAIRCAIEAFDFEDAIRNAISIGGDSDTVAAITGSIAEAMFGIPDDIRERALSYLPEEMVEVVDRFVDRCHAPAA